MATVTACVTCGADLPADAGNRRRYCDADCKRTAEYELRRANGLLYRAEKQVQEFSARLAGGPKSRREVPGGVAGQLKFWQSEVVRLRGRLAELLAEGS